MIFKERLCDNFKQNWHEKLISSEYLECYSSYKSMIVTEQFLNDRTLNRYTRNILLRFRFGVSDILCHRFKFYTNNETLTICPLCKSAKEDEYHVMYVCDTYENLRTNLLPEKFSLRRNKMTMYIFFADSRYYSILATYLCNMFKLRSSVLSERST